MKMAPTLEELAEGLEISLELVDRFGPEAMCYVRRMVMEIQHLEAEALELDAARDLLRRISDHPRIQRATGDHLRRRRIPKSHLQTLTRKSI